MTVLTELFQTSDMNKLKQEIARLVELKNYKAINALLRRIKNKWSFNTRELNEEIQCDERHFTKRKSGMKFEYQPRCNTVQILCKV